MYKTANGFTKQTIIERIQKEFKGMAEIGHGMFAKCVFLTPEGKKCAIGLFIPEPNNPAES